MKENKIQNDIVRSEDVQDILSAPPAALVRVGSSVIGAIMLVIFVGCFFFKYPDIIACDVTITNNTPPVIIVAKTILRSSWR